MARNWKTILLSVPKEALIILLTILLCIVYYAICLPFLIIMLTYRKSVIYFAKCRHESANWIPTSIVSGALITDSLNKSGMHCFGFSAELKKPCDHQILIDRVDRMLRSNEKAELKSCVTRWMGVNFLTPCSKFPLSSIISVNPTTNVDEVSEFIKSFTHQEFGIDQPLWNIHIFPNAKEASTTFCMRVHHGLLDGISALRVLRDISDPDPEADQKVEESISKIMKKYMAPLSWDSRLLIALEFFILTPSTLYSLLKTVNVNSWTTPGCSGAMIQHQQRFDLERVRNIGKRLGYNSNTIFSGALIGAIREEMKARGDSVDNDIALGFVLPSPKNITQRLSNNFIITAPAVPTSLEGMQRLKSLADLFQKMKRPARVLHFQVVTLFYFLGASLLGFIKSPKFSTSGSWSNVSLFGSDFKMLGYSLSDMDVHTPPQMSGLPILYGVAAFEKNILFAVTTYESIFKDAKSLENFFDRVENELDKYSKYIPVMESV